jgi:membrane-bound ClpP family serine protease
MNTFSVVPLLAESSNGPSFFYYAFLGGVVGFCVVAAGRRRAKKGQDGLQVSPLDQASPPLKAGMLGKAETDCPKEGLARFGDQCFAVVNQGRPIKKGDFVVIREVAGGRVVVLPKPLNSI